MMQHRTSALRRLSIYGFDLVAGGHNFHALLEFDITGLRSYLRAKRQEGEGGSLFAFLVKAIADCLKDFPEFNAMGNARTTTRFSEVDVGIPIEMERDGEYYNKQYIIRNAQAKTVRQISEEVDASKKSAGDEEGFVSSPFLRALLSRLPGPLVVALFKAVLADHRKVKELSGTVFVTSVSMFSNAPGYVIPFAGGPKAMSFAIGSTVRKPAAVKDKVEIREMINITASFNHDLVDGAPAARFINALRNYIEAPR